MSLAVLDNRDCQVKTPLFARHWKYGWGRELADQIAESDNNPFLQSEKTGRDCGPTVPQICIQRRRWSVAYQSSQYQELLRNGVKGVRVGGPPFPSYFRWAGKKLACDALGLTFNVWCFTKQIHRLPLLIMPTS